MRERVFAKNVANIIFDTCQVLKFRAEAEALKLRALELCAASRDLRRSQEKQDYEKVFSCAAAKQPSPEPERTLLTEVFPIVWNPDHPSTPRILAQVIELAEDFPEDFLAQNLRCKVHIAPYMRAAGILGTRGARLFDDSPQLREEAREAQRAWARSHRESAELARTPGERMFCLGNSWHVFAIVSGLGEELFPVDEEI